MCALASMGACMFVSIYVCACMHVFSSACGVCVYVCRGACGVCVCMYVVVHVLCVCVCM